MSPITYDPRAFARHAQHVATQAARAKLTQHHAALRIADCRLAIAFGLLIGAALGFTI